jgi:hypothetical protein
MLRHKSIIALTALGLLLIATGWIAAQETPTPIPTPEPTPIPVTLLCDPAELLRQQAELSARLQTLTQDLAGASPEVGLDSLFKVGQAYQQLALDCGYIPADAAERPVGSDVQRILAALDTVYGDPLNGQLLYNGELACAGCHLAEAKVAPPTEGTYTRVLDERLLDPALSDYTPTQYLVESIIDPGHYLVPGYTNIMVSNFGDRISLQQLADVLSFLESQDGPSPE